MKKITHHQTLPFYGPCVFSGHEISLATETPKFPEGLYIDITQNADTGEITYIRIGTEYHGPVVQWHGASRKWTNLFSRGNFGKNFSSGGGWSSLPPEHTTLNAALNARSTDFETLFGFGAKAPALLRARMIEGPGLMELLRALAELERPIMPD